MADQLEQLRSRAAEARDLELAIEDAESALKELRARLYVLYHDALPTLMNRAGVDVIGVPPAGNKIGANYLLRPYYSASISSDWEPQRRDDAFAVLKKYRAESLIKTAVVARLPKGNVAAARKIAAGIKKLKIKGASVELGQSVHSATLRAWLKEVYEAGKSLPSADLEKIGASVGQYVKAADRRDD